MSFYNIMFQIITSNTIPDIDLKVEPKDIFIPCFYLTNSNSLTNFAPMFNIESKEEDLIDIENFNYVLSTIPSQYQMLEINIDSLEVLDEISTLYINGVPYQNLLGVEELILFPELEVTQVIEEREST